MKRRKKIIRQTKSKSAKEQSAKDALILLFLEMSIEEQKEIITEIKNMIICRAKDSDIFSEMLSILRSDVRSEKILKYIEYDSMDVASIIKYNLEEEFFDR